MADKSAIEWCDATWTPIRARRFEQQSDGSVKERVGWHCEHVSEACRNCYAEAMNLRLGTGLPFKPGHKKDIDIFLDEDMLLAPLRWKKPRKIFPCSMTDLFADFVKDEWIDRMFAVMALCPHHTFLPLTKRPERMREHLTSLGATMAHIAAAQGLVDAGLVRRGTRIQIEWPLPNVWAGTSAGDQNEAFENLPELLETPAKVRFVSAEPLLGPIDFTRFLWGGEEIERDGKRDVIPYKLGLLHLVILGGESGPKARGTNLKWHRDIIEDVRAAGVAVFEKQVGRRPYVTSPPLRSDQASQYHFLKLKDRKGGDMAEWPKDLRVREFPNV